LLLAPFCENDVIFLGDMPGPALSTRFLRNDPEFVSPLAAGWSSVAGPRFVPGQLAENAVLRKMLPVIVYADFAGGRP